VFFSIALDTLFASPDNGAGMKLDGAAKHRAGFVALLGKPNVGKSTLLNTLIGQSLAPVSRKPQTTRNSQVGIVNTTHAQLVFHDTPGLHQAQDRLGETMNQVAEDVARDADVLLVLFNGVQKPDRDDQLVQELVSDYSKQIPTLYSLNKVERLAPALLADRGQEYSQLIGSPALIQISALTGLGIDSLLTSVTERLPQAPPLFEQDVLTLSTERELAADLIRAASLDILRQEVPYSIAVRIDEFKERGQSGAYIRATLFVERESQKGIVIGKGGTMLKQIGIAARKKIEDMSSRSVHLELRVKVLRGWKNDPRALQRLGYQAGKG
jgi:GTP-binding protein Era